MEDFTSDIESVQKIVANLSELNNRNMDLLNCFSEMNQPLNSQLLNCFSSDNVFNNGNTEQPQPHPPYANEPLQFHIPEGCTFDQTSANTSAQPCPIFQSDEGGDRNNRMGNNNNNITGKKRKRKTDEVVNKPKEVIHVRAKRGQATDSHSLAERVRRERINEKLKVLQDLVPGCYKTMGMAVMLDVIINYLQSLQNQIEFLSMKLSAASMFYDFNSPEAEAIEALQRTTTTNDAHEVETVTREGNEEILPRLHPTWQF